MKRIHIKNGRVIDPAHKRDGVFDLVLEGGKILDVLSPQQKVADAEVVDATGMIVSPGFIDLHTHLREPGQEYKETIETGTQAAAAGGFTSVCCMANTVPVNDHAAVTEAILKKAREFGVVNVFPIGALTKGLKGQELAEIGELYEAGCVGLSDDGLTIENAAVMRMAMSYAKNFNLPVISHAIEPNLAKNGCMHEGAISTRLGLSGIPGEAEDIIIARDIYLAQLTGASLHVAHVATAEGIELVRRAKKKGLPVTCEVTPHHIALTDEAVIGYNTHCKMAPPLRPEKDRLALIEGLADGTVDAIATDHAPHALVDKEVEFDKAANGVVGLETAFQIVLELVHSKKISLNKMVELLTLNPAKIVSLKKGSLAKGADADVVLFDVSAPSQIDPSYFHSKSKNTPFIGRKVSGKIMNTWVLGKSVYRPENS